MYIMTFLTSSIYEKPTGVKLAETLGFTPVNSLSFLRGRDREIFLMRYGLTSYPRKEWRFDIVLNKASKLKVSQSKLRSLVVMDLDHVNVPEYYDPWEVTVIGKFPVLGRTMYHSRGRDIVYINSLEKLRNSPHRDYYVQFIPSTSEYRVHVFNGEAIRIQKKIAKGEEHFIRNIDHNYSLSDIYDHNLEEETDVIVESLKAVDSLDLDFGAVDVLYSEEGYPFVLEVNSAPRLNKYGRQLYSYIIEEYLWKEGILSREPELSDYPRLRENDPSSKYGFDLPIRFRHVIPNH